MGEIKLNRTRYYNYIEERLNFLAYRIEKRGKINLYDIKDYHTSEIGDFFRLRIGKYRAIFKINKDVITILVLDIGSRGDIYKK